MDLAGIGLSGKKPLGEGKTKPPTPTTARTSRRSRYSRRRSLGATSGGSGDR